MFYPKCKFKDIVFKDGYEVYNKWECLWCNNIFIKPELPRLIGQSKTKCPKCKNIVYIYR